MGKRVREPPFFRSYQMMSKFLWAKPRSMTCAENIFFNDENAFSKFDFDDRLSHHNVLLCIGKHQVVSPLFYVVRITTCFQPFF